MKNKILLTASVAVLCGSLMSCAPKETTYKLGVGSMCYIYNNNNADHNLGHKVQVKVASVIFDKNDKVVDASIDEIQVPLTLKLNEKGENEIVLDTEGQQMVELAPEGQSVASKKEIGENYAKMPSGKWFEQVENFEKWTIGKSLDEIKGAADETGHVKDVVAGTSINMGDGHIPTMFGALANAKEFTVVGDEAPRASIGACSTYTKGNKVEFNIAASALVDNKISSTMIDVYQASVVEGKVEDKPATDKNGHPLFSLDASKKEVSKAAELVKVPGSLVASKRELHDLYGMAKVATKGEWYTQAEFYENWAVGKTEEEIKAGVAEGGKAASEDLKTGCTIGVKEFSDAVAETFHNFRK